MLDSANVECFSLQTQLIHKDAKLPYKKRPTDAGWDIYSVEDVTIAPKSSQIIHTGILIAAPPSIYYTIEGRSSLWRLGIFPNRGVIDSAYNGEVVVSLVNMSDVKYDVRNGDRIAQLLFHKVLAVDFNIVSEFDPEYTIRGTDGFGSSGR